jgi:hypothetical protein
MARNPGIKSGASPSGSRSDACPFCGVWKGVVGGRLMGRRADDYAGKTGNPYCGCDYLRITEAGLGRFKLSMGSEYEGKINWSGGGVVINNADGIYLRLLSARLTARFVSPNFYATHGMDFTYKITCELKNNSELIFLFGAQFGVAKLKQQPTGRLAKTNRPNLSREIWVDMSVGPQGDVLRSVVRFSSVRSCVTFQRSIVPFRSEILTPLRSRGIVLRS